MKKILLIIIVCISFLVVCFFSPLTNITKQNNDIVEIKEKMFVAQTYDIYINSDEYMGKTIKYEGIFQSYYWDEMDAPFHSVIRYGPGCCGMDGHVGFEVIWDGEYPEPNDWVEVIGVLESYEENGYDYLILNVSSLTVMSVRGEETVIH